MLARDGTFQILDDRNGSLLTIGALIVDSAGGYSPSKLQRKFRPFLHFITHGETLAGVAVMLKLFQTIFESCLSCMNS